jgi:soluble lytic murein transglycosylase-like protein
MEVLMISLLITYYALVNGINPSLAMRMAKIESNMNPNAVSHTGDGGLFQLNDRAHKFHNPEWRYIPVTNTSKAMYVLGKLRNSCKHKDNNSFVLCYNLGRYGASKIKHPYKHPYYRKFSQVYQ